MLKARPLAPLLAALALAAVPATAGARLIQTIPLDAPSDGVAFAEDGTVHVIEPATQTDAIFGRDGTLIKRVTLPGPVGTARDAMVGTNGLVWVAIGSRDATRGFAELDGSGLVRTISTAAQFTCPPAEMARVSRDGPMIYTAVDPGDGAPCTGGVGEIMPDGTAVKAMTATVNGGIEDFDYDGYVPVGDAVKQLGEYDTVFDSHYPPTFPAGSAPADVLFGAGAMFVTLPGTGQVGVFLPESPGLGTQIAASGVEGPRGLLASPRYTMLVAAHDGDRLVEIPPLSNDTVTGTPSSIPLPPGFHPNRMATSGGLMQEGMQEPDDDVWVTDDETAQVARVVDGVPSATITGATATGLDFDLDTAGNDTSYSVVVTRPDGGFVEDTADQTVTADLAIQHVHAALPALATGTYKFELRLRNGGGSPTATLPVTGATVQGPPSHPGEGGQIQKPPVQTVPARTVKPAATDLIALASPTRCVAGRRLRLRLVAHPRHTKARVTAVRVTVGKGRPRTYTGKRLKAGVELTGLPKGRYALKLVVTLSDHTTASLSRTYRACSTRKR